jgi:hypothetical protein
MFDKVGRIENVRLNLSNIGYFHCPLIKEPSYVSIDFEDLIKIKIFNSEASIKVFSSKSGL